MSVTPKSFLESYEEYAYDVTDSPKIYHHMHGLGLVAHAVGRTPLNLNPPGYANLYLAHLGAPGKTRKSNSQKAAKRILPPKQRDALPQSFSPEGLQDAIADCPQGSMFIEEIGGLLESIRKRDYMAGTSDLLCELYDCPDHYERRLRGKHLSLDNVYLNIASATTPSRFLESVRPSRAHLSDRSIQHSPRARATSETLWPHLFRETVASDIVKQDNSIIAAFKVQKKIDLEDMRTGFNYLQRFAKDIIKRETK